jgi:hypothetical protein
MKSIDVTEILKGIYAQFANDAALKAKVNYSPQFPGCYILQPKQGAPMPYIVIVPQADEPWDCLGEDGATGEYFYYQLSVFSAKYPDPREALDIVKEITRVYDDQFLTIAGYATVRNERLDSMIPVPQPEKNLIHALVRYRLFLHRQ